MPKDSVRAPRFSTGHHEGSFNPNPNRRETLGKLGGLAVEDRISEDVVAELKTRGHKVRTFSGANSHPVMLYVDPETGMMYAAGDPRVGRHAAVLEKAAP
jgi:gamma-glutamyltranspeptidase/glutathione hydrolase